MILTKYWCRTKCLQDNSKDEIFNYVFAHCNDDKEIYPLTVEEIAKAQIKDKTIQKVKDKYDNKLVENIHVLCKNERLVIPKKLQYRAVAWYVVSPLFATSWSHKTRRNVKTSDVLDRDANISPTICKTV